jgi:cell division protein FtsA
MSVIAAVEIGTHKTCALLGEIIGGRSLNIIEMVQGTSMGLRKGEITNLRAVSDCTHAVLHTAEKNSGAQIETVYLACTGKHLDGITTRNSIAVSSANNIVTERDCLRAGELAKSRSLPSGRLYIHHIHGGYLLDGREVANPVEMHGDQLEVSYWHVHGDERKIADQLHVINGYGVKVGDMILSSIASGFMVATEVERRTGALVVDIGGGTTDYALYQRGNIVRTGVIPVGGDHLTNDLSLGLRMTAKNAESVKLRFGKATVDAQDKAENVLLIGDLTIGDRPIPRIAISRILQSRIDELFGILKNKLGSAISPQNIPGGIIITGGTSRLPRIAEAARNTLGVEARVAQNPAWVTGKELRGPEFSTVLGLLHYGLTAQENTSAAIKERNRKRPRLLNRVAGIFASN